MDSPLNAVLRHPDMSDGEAIALGALPQFDSGASSNGCSAAMLNSEWAVTAAHCTSLADEQRVTLFYSKNGVTEFVSGTAYRTESGDGGYDDVALIHLDTPIEMATAWVAPYDRFDEYDQLGWQTGRGTSGALGVSVIGSDGVYRAMTQRIFSTKRESDNGEGSSIIPQHIFYNYNGSPESTNPNQYTTRFEGGTGPGDSGGSFYVYSRGRFFTASVVSGPSGDSNSDYRNGRLSTHGDAILARSGLEFAYPQNLAPRAIWVAEDLVASQANLSVVTSWSDRLAELSWSNQTDGGVGEPLLVHDGTPTGLAAVRFDGDDALGLSLAENPFAGQTAISVAMVIRTDAVGEGFQTDPFGTTGILDASNGDNAWGLSFSRNGRYGWAIEAQDDSVTTLFRPKPDSSSYGDGEWHVAVATWDGSEILNDNAGDDRNMKLFVDTVDNIRTGQGAYHFNVGRAALSLLLGDSQTNTLDGFKGDIAELRFYSGELQMHEVDRLLNSLRARYVDGQLGVVFERPWSNRITVEAGQGLLTRGLLTGGATSMEWTVTSGAGNVSFTDSFSPSTEITFDALGTYVLNALSYRESAVGITELIVDVVVPGEDAPTMTAESISGSWLSSDIGSVGMAGSFFENSSVYTLSAAGEGVGIDVGETYDEGQFVWKALTGDFDIVVRLDSVNASGGLPEAGLMIRGGAGPTDAAGYIGYTSAGTLRALFRTDGGYYADLTEDTTPGFTLPVYLKIERRNEQVSVYHSVDGISYNLFASNPELRLPGIVRAGMFAASGDDTVSASATFSEVSLEAVSSSKLSSPVFEDFDYSTAEIAVVSNSTGADEPWLDLALKSGPVNLDFTETYRAQNAVQFAIPPVGGDYTLRLLADDGCGISFLQRSAPIRFNQHYEFDTDGDAEGWTGNNIENLTINEGILTATASTNDPQINISGLSLAGSGYTQLAVRLRSAHAGAIQLFWSRVGGSGFTVARSVTADYAIANEFQTVVFDLNEVSEWDGESITGLRLDPLNGSVTGIDFEIDYIEISDGKVQSDDIFRYDFDEAGNFENWTRVKDFGAAIVLGGSLQAQSTGSDPILTNNLDDFSGSHVAGVLLRMKSSVSGRVDLFWTTSETSGFAAARKVEANYSGGDDWQYLYISLSEHAEWDGKTITQLRLDPTNISGADFAIDLIASSDGDYDGDSLPDVYEATNGFDPTSDMDALMDADGDGFNNVYEYIAGTGPQSVSDRFDARIVSSAGSAMALSVNGRAGRIYRLMRSFQLVDPVWVEVDSVSALTSDMVVNLSDDTIHEKVFYQIEVSLP
ncbi:LamG-like jellyroll fold domain-containing protein [Rubellicoccus peritrichatus]|uniref:LamG-like jellyroll fold domain-containing protein n=1 Tax=Rubellicoccus peritrichatus TaxID=3080537 RepID=A0AAQ3LJF1_9BACT|nr:LamG-like jellyroll fold domain-containing protein [Puniceicoccus sp. CR14]WOO43309.1 LamG-like jellyroll fold domain-containing protein [Puniceicoccus sp. CR14]